MRVIELWRYPVKAMLGERVEAVDIDRAGLHGDRRFIVVDLDTGERIANKHGPTDPRLRACRAELLGTGEPASRITVPEGAEAAPPVRITLPDGRAMEGTDVAPALSALLERRVALLAHDGPDEGRYAATGAHHDFAPVHLLTTGTLAHLEALAPETAWDVRRFRPNLLLDHQGAPGAFAEDDLLGRSLRAPGSLELAVGLPTPRCVVPTRAHEDVPADPQVLRVLERHHRWDLEPLSRSGCAGAYAEVVAPGALAVGDRLAAGPRGAASADEAVAAVLAAVLARSG